MQLSAQGYTSPSALGNNIRRRPLGVNQLENDDSVIFQLKHKGALMIVMPDSGKPR
jgi:hypothetical protein